MRQGLIATVALLTPVFVTLYFLTLPNGPWLVVLVSQLIATVIVGFGIGSYYWTRIWLAPGLIEERGFFGRRTRFELADIGSVLFVETYTGHATERTPQLFVRGHGGEQLVRMRGQFWSRESMEIVAERLGAPVTRTDEALSIAELRRDYPGTLYWFERYPVAAAFVFAALIAVAGALLLWVLHLLGKI